ncbi:MAG: LysR family transcriptional regulator [Clostridia bacterium]|nr:LysR family transcriptional regulator [Clostridia bacterium]
MELRNLTTFIHVAELGSFSKTAEMLGYSQSTISFQIKQLEEELGCLLFDRINHTVRLTERGHQLISCAHQIRTLTEEFKDSLRNGSECSGHIHIVAPDSVCEELIHKHYIGFHSRYPSISLKFTPADTSVMVEMLDRNEADLIITLDSHMYRNDYVIAKEEPLTMHFVAGSSSAYAGRKGLSIHDIAQEPFVLTEYGQGYRRVLDKELAKCSLEIVPVLEIGRTDMITSVLCQSNMISFLPDFVTASRVRSGELCYLDVCDIDIAIYKQLIYHKNKWLSRSMKIFIDYLKQTQFSV